MGLLFTKRIPCNENEHLYAVMKRSISLMKMSLIFVLLHEPEYENG